VKEKRKFFEKKKRNKKIKNDYNLKRKKEVIKNGWKVK
jgi:hypothetical protein